MIRVSSATARALGVAGRSERCTKFGNKRTEYNGRVYDSKAEAQHASDLDLLLRAGELVAVIPQVSIPIPHTQSRMVLDFLLIDASGRAIWQDVKGAPPTRAWLLKRQIVEGAYGIAIEIVKPARRR